MQWKSFMKIWKIYSNLLTRFNTRAFIFFCRRLVLLLFKFKLMTNTLHYYSEKSKFLVFKFCGVIFDDLLSKGWSAHNKYREVLSLYIYLMNVYFRVPLNLLSSTLPIEEYRCKLYVDSLKISYITKISEKLDNYSEQYDITLAKLFK